MTDYIVTTKNNEYEGKTFGVVFRAGRAFVNEHTIDPSLGLTVEEVIRGMERDFGYTAKKVSAAAASLPTRQASRPSRKRIVAGAAAAPEVADGKEEKVSP